MQWSVKGQTAELTGSGWNWHWDMARPQAGVTVLGAGHAPWQLLAITPVPNHTCQIEDWFARGSDLMVRYGQSADDTFAFQIDFRRIPDAELGSAAGGFDVWLSVQTQLLDSHPVLEVANHIAQGQWRASDEAGAQVETGAVAKLQCQTACGFVAMLVHPSDQSQAELLRDAGEPRLRLFGNFMEKGVIRRGRVRCLVSSEQVTEKQLEQAYQAFADSPLPLTT